METETDNVLDLPWAARTTPTIELCCLDMAGTTVHDDGAATAAFSDALTDCGVAADDPEREEMLAYVNETMGTSKIVVFRQLFGDDALAQKANAAFEEHYGRRIASGEIAPIPGAEATIATLRVAGVRTAFLTGFSTATRDRLLQALGWEDLADVTLTPAEAGRGRPFPDLVLTAALRTEVSDVAAVAVVGDTPADMATGRAAGASQRVGVLTGASSRAELVAAGATAVLGSVAELPELFGIDTHPGA